MPSILTGTGDASAMTTAERDKRVDRLRTLGRKEADKYRDLAKRSQEAFQRGDKALASRLSKESKKHQKKLDKYNKQAKSIIISASNAKHSTTTIDLHGLFVKEAEKCLLKRMNEVKAAGEERICVIVGKGNHAQNGPKIKPAVEKMCVSRGLKFTYEVNRMRVNEGKIIILLEDYVVEDIGEDSGDSDVCLDDVEDSDEEEVARPSTRFTSPLSPVVTAPRVPPTPVVTAPRISQTPVVTAPQGTQTRLVTAPWVPSTPTAPFQRPPPREPPRVRPTPPTPPPQPRPVVSRPPVVRPPVVRPPVVRPPVGYSTPPRPVWDRPPAPVQPPPRYYGTINDEEAGRPPQEKKSVCWSIVKPIIFVVVVVAYVGCLCWLN